jgi:NAD(P)-dependent dehydrogenase (short-subunit alcohol dehydrogenase family)
MSFYKNPVAIITGANKTIGKAICETLSDCRLNTALIANNHSNFELKSKKQHFNRVIAMNLDVNDCIEVNTTVNFIFSQFGRIDYLINVAGIADNDEVEASSEESWDEILVNSIKGYLIMAKAVLPFMKQVGKGSIINVFSMEGIDDSSTLLAHSTSKFALEGLTKSLLDEARPHGIGISSIIMDEPQIMGIGNQMA